MLCAPRAPGGAAPGTRLMLSRLGIVVNCVGWAAFHGDLLRLRGVMLGLLPHLFRLQELAGGWGCFCAVGAAWGEVSSTSMTEGRKGF